MPRRLVIALKIILTLGVVGLLVMLVDLEQIVASLREARGAWIGAAILLLPVNLLLEGLLWHRLVRRVHPRARFRRSLGALLSGYALGYVTPGSVGSYAGRAFYLDHDDRWMLSALLFYQYKLDHLVAASAGLGGLLVFLSLTTLPGLWWVVVAYVAANVLVLAPLVLAPRAAYRVLRRVLPFAAVQKRLVFLRDLPIAAGASWLALSALRYGVYTGQLVVLFYAFEPALVFETAALGAVLVILAGFVVPPVTVMELGIREGAAVFFLGALGAGEAAAFNASLLLSGINFLLPAVLGVPFLWHLRGASTTP